MEKCPHLEKLTVSKDLSLLDPSKWLCSVCGTTEWVWACLSCAHVACGRLNEKHAVNHYEATQHHIAIEINEKYVYCYTCDDYIMGDNRCGDLEAIRSALTAIGTMSFEGIGSKGGNLLRSFSHQQDISYSHTDEDDRLITAQIHHRKSILDKVFTAWVEYVQKAKKEKKTLKKKTLTPSNVNSHSEPPPMVTRSRSGLFHFKKRTLVPGVTGLRNLGNTCYINSIIQSLGHLEDFREYFCQLVFDLFSPSSTPPSTSSSFSPTKGPLAAARQLLRLNTIDYYQHLNTIPTKSSKGPSKGKKGGEKGQKSPAGGLNGGRADPGEAGDLNDLVTNDAHLMKAKADALNALSLCQELHGLLRVLWSGKWAQVSPHGFLHSVWRAIPVFKGHAQHDAQEFLCELLDKLSQEIENLPQCKGSENIVDQSFRGELVSQVTCLSCKNTSRRYEPFLDLSLEFPPLFQQTNSQSLRKMCHLTEMLFKFTEQEELEPKSYSCEKCNSKRRRSSRQSTSVKTDASKQLLISKPPEILRLHLKRFRWCGRNHREKINTHVAFDDVVDISSFCLDTGSYIPQYRLQAVVVHHGAGFRAGHYTAYTYNNDAGSWVHCNDSRVNLVSEEEVLLSQAYILFYTREMSEVGLNDMPTLAKECTLPLMNQSTISTIPELDAGSMHTLRRLSRGETEQIVDDDISISFHRDPTLIQRLTSIRSESDLKRTITMDLSTASSPPSSNKKSKRLSLQKTKTSHRLTSSQSNSNLRVSVAQGLHSAPTLPLCSTNNFQPASSSSGSGMKRATSSPPSVNKFMRLDSLKGRKKINCHPSNQELDVGSEQTVQSLSREETEKILDDEISEFHQGTALKEDVIKEHFSLPCSMPSLSRQETQDFRTASAMKDIQRQSSSSSFLKNDATLNFSTLSPTLISEKIQSMNSGDCKTSFGVDMKTEDISFDLSSQSLSPTSMTTSRTPEKNDKSSQVYSTVNLDLKREATLNLSPESLSTASEKNQRVNFEKERSSPKRQSQIRLDLGSEALSPCKIIKRDSPVKVATSPQKQRLSSADSRREATKYSFSSSPSKDSMHLISEKRSSVLKQQTSTHDDMRTEATFSFIQNCSPSLIETVCSSSLDVEKISSQRQSSSPSKGLTNKSPEKANSCPTSSPSTCLNMKRDTLSSSSKLVESATPKKTINSPEIKFSSNSDRKKENSLSPQKLFHHATPEKAKSSPKRNSSIPSSIKREHTSSPNKMAQSTTPEKADKSLKRNSSICSDLNRENFSSPSKTIQGSIPGNSSSGSERNSPIKSAVSQASSSEERYFPVNEDFKREASFDSNFTSLSPTKLSKSETPKKSTGSPKRQLSILFDQMEDVSPRRMHKILNTEKGKEGISQLWSNSSESNLKRTATLPSSSGLSLSPSKKISKLSNDSKKAKLC